MQRATLAALLVAALLVAPLAGVAAGSHEEQSDDATPTPTPTPTATEEHHDTATPTETHTPEPTPEPTATPEPTPEPTPTREASRSSSDPQPQPRREATPEPPNEVVAEVDEDVRVTDYGYDDGNATFWVALSHVGSRSSRVTITEAITGDESGAGTFGIEQVRVRPDEQLVVHVSIDPNADPKGVMITTSKSINKGQGTYLQLDSGGSLFDFAASWGIVRVAWLFGVTASFGALFGGAWWLVSSRHEDAADADLDPDQTLWGGLR